MQPSNKDLELVESQLQREVREREEELERLKIMIRDKKLAMESRKTFASSDGQEQSGYDKLSQEIDSVKVMVLNLRANQLGVDLDEDKVAHPVFMRRLHQKKTYSSYSLSEISAFIEIKLPKAKAKRQKFENDRVIMRQLVSNIERNRMMIRKDLLETRGGAD